MSRNVKNRSELLFVYDCKDANPNGDPLDENKPRMDEETGVNIVTDVRLKRTIRDYFKSKGIKIWVEGEKNEKGELKTREEKIKELGKNVKKYNLVQEFLDLRLFGATIGLDKSEEEDTETGGKSKGKSISFTGPVQFKFGRSLHEVDGPTLIKGTTVLPSKKGKEQGTFTETWVLPYSLICFYGIINENAAKEVNLTEDDIKLLLEGMWNGTKNLISRSKIGHSPRLLTRVVYKEGAFQIGDLDKKIKIETSKSPKQIRDISEITLDLTELISTLEAHKDKIEKVEWRVDPRCKIKGELENLKDIKQSRIEIQ